MQAGSGPDSIVLQVSEDAYANGDGASDAQGDATFTVSVDGKQIGGTFTASTSHSAGQEQSFTINGSFGAGNHTVSVDFLNDAWNGTAATDRNLYVDSIAADGSNANQSAALMSSGTQDFSVAIPVKHHRPRPLRRPLRRPRRLPVEPIRLSAPVRTASCCKISEDAYTNGDGTSDAQGDATFTVSVDGKRIGGILTATASHAAGQEQSFTINGSFDAGNHKVSVDFLNDAWDGTVATDRNLYVISLPPMASTPTKVRR